MKIEDSIYAKEQEINKLRKRQEELQRERDRAEQVKIVIRGSLYPGVLVNINGSRWNSKPIKNVTLKKNKVLIVDDAVMNRDILNETGSRRSCWIWSCR